MTKTFIQVTRELELMRLFFFVGWQKTSQFFGIVDYVKEMIAKNCKYGEQRSFEHFFFLISTGIDSF